TLTVSCTVQADGTITVSDAAGVPTLGIAVSTGGNYTITTSALADGSHTLTATATDAAGNEGAASTGFTVIEDTVAPNAPSISTVNDNTWPVTGHLANGASTIDTTLTVSGTAEAGSTVTIYDTDGTTVLGTGVATRSQHTALPTALADGSHTLTATATDAAGNEGAASTGFTVIEDTVAPNAPSTP